ncbi:Polyketide synthetase [Mycena venus]|uniref:Polyketide synthetase n=1 Tax=Mycena venus TaxID=2733690 RepID=A0A8H7CD88_9AGAR|nr:Polyketide synthetase [Mycena venus]
MSDPGTLLDVFHQHVADVHTRGRHAVECADEHWTYDDLDAISTGLALELKSQYGSRLTVAIIAENLPYTFALHLAVWKLGGIVAPIDYHTPPALLEPMLRKVLPACVVVPSTEQGTQEVVLDSGFPLLGFMPQETTMAALSQRFMGAPDPPRDLPTPADICIYLFTSSASDVSNIKCVPLTHHTLLVQSQSLLAWNKSTFPSVMFQNLRVLGWGLFSHMLATIDISTHVLLTAGCYIFGQTPSGYFLPGSADQSSRDVPSAMLRAMEKYRLDSVASVPWMFEGIREAVEAETNFERQQILLSTLRRFKLVILGGAPTSEGCIKWALENQIRLVLSIGMTELGGCLFHKVAEENNDGWLIEDRVLSDAQLTLVDNDGKPHDLEGELYISSKVIARGYLDYHPSPFVVSPDGIITFKTGDRYAKSDGRLKWLGRKDDFILLVSGEMVDPRALERTINACPSASRSCVIGNNFLRSSSEFLCVVIELRAGAPRGHPSTNLDISRVVRSVNRELAPPLRIKWTRVLILEDGEHIPINRKGQIWRKKLEALYGNRVASLSSGSFRPVSSDVTSSQPSQTFIRDVVLAVVADALGIPLEALQLNAESTFAELGMDSSAALVIVGQLNQRFKLSLPRNTCHTHIDLVSLTAAISERLRQVEAPAPAILSAGRLVDGDALNDVVIVGQAIKLPGNLDTPESFWEALVDMREDLLVPVPQDRWDHASFFTETRRLAQSRRHHFRKSGIRRHCHLRQRIFGISSAEAFSVAPAARLVLETTFQALENANIPASRLKGTDTGVFTAGSMDHGYTQLMFASMGFGTYTRFHGTGSANSAVCGRISYLLDVHGPSVSFDTACSSGMVAFDQAVQYLRFGRAETAIVCGANTHPWPGDFGFLSAQNMTSPNSRCATFSSDANGYVPAEGAVSLILKTRNAALRDGDTIFAVIKATDTQHNGRSQGLVAPSATAQASLQRSLLTAASLSSSDIDFVETHGTGTSLGDLIEIEGLNATFRGSHTSERPLILGAAKTTVGHTEVIAGLVGIVKAIKQLSTGKVAGLSSLANGKLNPEIDTALVPLCIPSHLTELPIRTDREVRALVVAYGFAGTLTGTILEAPPRAKLNAADEHSSWMIFTVSAKSPDALHSYLRLYLDFCAKAPSTAFRSICYTSCVGRELYRYRFSCVAKDLDGLVQRLKDRLSQAQSSPSPPNPRIIFAFPGQGSQFFGMASALSQTFSQFKEILADAATLASSHVDFDVLSLLLGTGQSSEEIDRSAVAQICIFVYQYAVCEFLRRLNVVPNAVMGNSLGEISAAVEAGALSYELGLQFVVARAKLLSPHPDLRPAGMAAIATTASAVLDYIHDLQLVGRVEISGFVSANTHVVSGDLDAIGIIVSHVKKQGLRASLLNVDQGKGKMI